MEVSKETYEGMKANFADIKLKAKYLPEHKHFRYLASRPGALRILSSMYYNLTNHKRITCFNSKELEKNICQRIVDILYMEGDIKTKLDSLKSVLGTRGSILSIALVIVLMDERLTDQIIDYYRETKNEIEFTKLLGYARSTSQESKVTNLLVSGELILSKKRSALIRLAPWLITIPKIHPDNLSMLLEFIIEKNVYCKTVTNELLKATQNLSLHEIFAIYRYPPQVSDQYLEELSPEVRRWFTLNETQPINGEELITYIYVGLAMIIKKVGPPEFKICGMLIKVCEETLTSYKDIKLDMVEYQAILSNIRRY
jgi:hypothetical protein